MNNSEPLYLIYESKRTGHAKDSLYCMMTGSAASNEFEIDRKKITEAGFELVLDAVRAASSIPCAATFHHYPSGSTVLVEDKYPIQPGVKIFGERKEIARNALVTLVQPYGFELKEEMHRI